MAIHFSSGDEISNFGRCGAEVGSVVAARPACPILNLLMFVFMMHVVYVNVTIRRTPSRAEMLKRLRLHEAHPVAVINNGHGRHWSGIEQD